MTDLSEIMLEMDYVPVKENIKNLFREFCDSRIIYILLENDKKQHILRKIRNEDWENEEERDIWLNTDINCYLAVENRGVYLTEEIYIQGCSFRDWDIMKYEILRNEITQQKYWEALYEMADDMADDYWACKDIVHDDIDKLFVSLLHEYNKRYIFHKTEEELLEYINMLCPEFCPK